MYLSCQCGYAFLVSAVWTGEEYYLVLRDAKRGKDSLPIAYCPQCGRALVLEDMDLYPPIKGRWPARPKPDPGTDAKRAGW